MGRYISKVDTYKGRLNAILLSFFYKKISSKATIISSSIFQRSKVEIGPACILYNCRIRVCTSSRHIKIGRGTRIENNAFLNAQTGSISIGSKCFIGPNTIVQGFGGVEMGDGILIAGNCFISSSNHVIRDVTREDFLLDEIGGLTKIGNKVWIGSNVTVLAGVTIGEYSVVGAGSVVTKDIPPYSIAVGNPAKVIKKIELKDQDTK